MEDSAVDSRVLIGDEAIADDRIDAVLAAVTSGARMNLVSDLEPIEPLLRAGEHLDRTAELVVRGWPLTVEGLRRNASATSSRFERAGVPFTAISAEVAVRGWTVDAILSGPRLRTRSRYAAVAAIVLLDAGFELLPTFAAPHYSVVLEPYTSARVEELLDLLGEIHANPHFVRRQP